MSTMRLSLPTSWLASFAITVLGSQAAFALPRPGEDLAKLKNSPLMADGDQSEYDFNGITKLNNCSGSLVRFENSKNSDKAMVLTNGHCVSQPSGGFIKPNQYLANTPVSRSFKFLKSDGSMSGGSVNSTKIIYATMTGSDMALYEVGLTYEEIAQKYSVDALTLSNEHPVVNEDIEILSGYWQKGYACHIDQFIYSMKEDAYTWSDSVRYSTDGCHTIHGTSGSPVLSKGSHKVIAINNTGNDDGERCTMNNPCEIARGGEVTFKKGLSYAQQTYVVYSCLNDKLQIDLTKAGCQLFH